MPGTVKTIGTSPTLLAAAKSTAQRAWLRIELLLSQSSDARIGVGDPAVTTTTGLLLERGRAMNIENTALAFPAREAIYGIVASGTVDVLVIEGT